MSGADWRQQEEIEQREFNEQLKNEEREDGNTSIDIRKFRNRENIIIDGCGPIKNAAYTADQKESSIPFRRMETDQQGESRRLNLGKQKL